MARLHVRGAAVVTMDDDLGDFERADLLIENGQLVAVGPDLQVGDAEVIDAATMIAIPGLVDTHRHTWQTGLRGILADGNIPDYLRGFRLQMATLYEPEDMYAGNLAGALDCLDNGVTTLVDYCHNIIDEEYARAAVEGLRDGGVRALYAHGLVPVTANTWSDDHGAGDSDFAGRAALARRIRSEYFASDDQLLRFGMAPQELAIAPVAEVAREFALARELDGRITFHANQVVLREPLRDVAVLHGRGLLGPDLTLVHATFTTPEEWALLDGTGTTISVCAETELQMGMGFPVIREATEHTPGPSLGIDCTSSTSGDMLAHARLVLQVSRWREDQASYAELRQPLRMGWTTRDALAWLTINGARAAGMDHLVGSLTPGKRADVVLLEMGGIGTAGWNRHDPAAAVIAQTNARHVDTVILDGRVVKRGGLLCHVDVDAALTRIEASHDRLEDVMAKNGGFIPQPPVPLPVFER
jgi:5-methylthioadenosine/S-adenosylhomocysteine deaminase